MSQLREFSDMQLMKMSRKALLVHLQDNREKHREVFLEAQKGYRVAVIEELDKMLHDARSGNEIKRQVTWPKPEDHTDEYDRSIRMLEMCVDDIIQISAEDFEQLVMDNWGWKRNWTNVVSNYHHSED